MAAIREELVGTLACEQVRRTIFDYVDRDPYLVMFRFHQQTWITWEISRDLLIAGVLVGAGEGDVLIRPTMQGIKRVVEITLRTPDGQASITFDHAGLLGFVQKSLDLVPLGKEHIDIDKEIAKSGLTGYSKGGTR